MTREISENSQDRISSLPDALLLHILSFMQMPDVIKTSILATRWRYLWTSILYLNFGFDRHHERDMVNFIDRSLSNHEGPKVKKLLIYILYEDTHALQVDSWIHFAVTHNVEELTLDFLGGGYPGYAWFASCYRLPNSLFDCRSVTTLKLSSCDLNLPASLHLSSLKSLALEFLDVSAETITHLTSGCPLLEDLFLRSCNRVDDLNISISNKNVKSLEILDYQDVNNESQIMIDAPNLLSLEFQAWMPRKVYDLKRLSSLVTAKFQVLSFLKVLRDGDGHEWARLLGDLHHVKELNFNWHFIQALSVQEVHNLNCIPLEATCMELLTDLSKLELPGIFYLLKSSSKLTTLTLNPGFADVIKLRDPLKDKFDFDEKEFWESKESEFSSMLQDLKTIKVMLSPKRPLSNAINFLRFLLKSSTAIERIIINVDKAFSNNSDALYNLKEEVLALPRVSQKSQVYFL